MKKLLLKLAQILSNRIDILIVTEVLLIGFIVFAKLFRPGLPAFEDNPPHFIEAWSLVNYIIPNNLGFSAWVNYDFAGFPIFMYHPYPLGFYIIYILQLIPGISLELAYKLIMYLSYVLPAICLYFVMRRKVGVDYALIPVALWMFNLYELDLVVQGMWSISLSMAPFILLLDELYNLLDDQEDKNHLYSTLKIGFLLSGILLLHSYTFLVSIMIIGLLVLFLLVSSFFGSRKKNNLFSFIHAGYNSKILFSLIFAVILTFVIDWFYIKNILISSNWPISIYIGGDTGDFFHLIFPYGLGLRSIYTFFLEHNYVSSLIIFLKHIFINLPNLFLLFIGILGLWYKKNKLLSIVNILVMIILIFVISGIFNFLNNFKIIKFLIMTRFVIFIQTIMLFYVSIGFCQMIQNKEKILQHLDIEKKLLFLKNSFIPKILIITFCILFIASEGNALFEVEKKMYVADDYQDFKDIINVFNWIGNVNESTRVYYQSTWDLSKDSGIDRSWIMGYASYYTLKPSLGSWSGLMPYPTYKNLQTYNEKEEIILGERVENFTDEKLLFILKAYNSKYIVVNSNSMKTLLDNSLLFDENFSSGRFTIYSINNYNPSYIQTVDSNSSISNIRFESELIEFDAFNTESINISVQYHPYWKAYSEGKPIILEKNDFNLMSLKISGKKNEKLPVQLIFEK